MLCRTDVFNGSNEGQSWRRQNHSGPLLSLPSESNTLHAGVPQHVRLLPFHARLRDRVINPELRGLGQAATR